jgi:hypothetical protein
MKRLTTRLLGGIAMCALLVSATMAPLGCSPATNMTAAQDIVNWTPSLESAVATIDATGALLDPAASVIFTAATAAFNAGATLVVADAKAYLANPSASLLTDLQTAVVSFQQTVSASILSAAKIVDPKSQQLALSVIQGVSTSINIILGLIQSVSTKAELEHMSADSPIKLAMIKPYLDANRIAIAAAKFHATPAQYFAAEARLGF